MKSFPVRFVLLAATLIVTFARCGSDSLTAPSGVVSVALTPPSATLRVGAAMQLGVTASKNGIPVTGETISFSSDNPATVSVTGAGMLSALSIGTATITAKSSSGASAVGTVTVVAGAPAYLVASAGDNQVATVGSPVPVPPAVTVRDSAGNPAANMPVTFSITGGGGSISGASTTTNAVGVATVGAWTLGSVAGPNLLIASVAGMTPITIMATAVAKAVGSIAINAGDGQTTASGAAVAVAPSVLVLNGAGQPSAGVSVTFAAGAGAGAVTGAAQVTNASGIATVGAWTLGAVGANSLTATAAGLSPVTFNAAATLPGTITITNTALSFAMTAGAATAGSQTVTILNGAAGTLSGLSIGGITYGAGATGWLAASLNANSSPSALTVTTSTATLLAGTYTASITILASGATNSPQSVAVTLTVNPVIPPSTIVFTQQPAGSASGTVLAAQPVLKFTDSQGATLTAMNGAVTVVIASGTGTLSGTTTVNAVNGIAAFTNLKIVGAGQFTLGFSASGATSGTSQSFAITALPATQIAVATQPAGGASNVPFTTQPVIELRDANGNPALGATGPVTVAIGAGGTGTGALSGTTSVTAVNGVATFTNLKVSTPGTYALTFTSGSLAAATSNLFTVTASPPVSVGVTTQPTGAVTGSPLATQPVAVLRDFSGTTVVGATNSVSAALAGAGGVLSGTTTVTAVNGVAIFTNLLVTGSGTFSLNLTSPGLGSTVTSAFTVTPLPPTQLGVVTQPVGGATGGLLGVQPVVHVRDALGSAVIGATNAVSATLVGAGGVLAGTQTVNAINGVATFTNLGVTGPGTYTLNFTAAGLTAAASSSFTITVLPPTQLAIGTAPTASTTGSILTTQPVVHVKDVNGAVVNGASNVVTASIGAGSAGALSGTLTATAVNGIATFTNLVISGAGTSTIAFTSPGLAPVTSAPLVVAALPASQLVVSTQPGGSGTTLALNPQPTVQIRDAANGVVAGATNQVIATLVGAGGTLSGTTTVTAVNGVATFTNLVVTGTGTFTLSFTATGLTAAASQSFTVTTLPPTQLAIITAPSGAQTGSAFATQPVIQVRDLNGAVVSGATNTVTATLNGGTGVLSGTTAVSAVNGVATFTNLSVTGSGTYTVAFSAAGLTPATSPSITITALPATQLAVATQPGGALTGASLSPQPVVQVRDASNGVVAGASQQVTAALVGAGGTLAGTTTVTAVNGVATFSNLVVNGAGTYTLSFTTAGLTTATSTAFTIAPLPATQLAITTQPVGAPTGSALATQPEVQVRDAANATVATATNSVTATLNGGGTLSGTTTVTAINGVATFTNLVVTGAGSYTLSFASSGLTSTPPSSAFTVTALPATKLAISVQPAAVNVVAGGVLSTQPVVQVQDANGGVVTTATNAVTATLSAGGTLIGAQTVNAVNGVATFTNLAVSAPGTYTLTFSSTTPPLTSTPASASFTVAAPFIGMHVGASSSLAATQGVNVAVPIVLDMSTYAACTPQSGSTQCAIGSLSFNVTWDATKLDYVSTANGAFGSSPAFSVNAAGNATGSISVSVFDASGFTGGTPTVFTVTLKPKNVSSSTVVTATSVVAGDDIGNDISNKVSVRAATVVVP